MSNPALQIQDLSFTWKGKSSFEIRIPELAISKGEKIFLKGESGSGKSTLLGLISGISQPDTGRICLFNTQLEELSLRQRDKFRAENIGVIFQQLNLIPFSTPFENIQLGLTFSNDRANRVNNQKLEILQLTESLGLPEQLILTSPSSNLSIGQQQRVAAARALIGTPKFIIADEPTSSLDEESQEAFIKLLFDHVEKIGATLLMVSHDMRLGSHFDRSVAMSDIAYISRSEL